jgi:hypothetical protein
MTGENAQFSPNGVNGPTLFALFSRRVSPEITRAKVTFNAQTSMITLKGLESDLGRDSFSEVVTCTGGSLIFTDKGSGHGDGTKLYWDYVLTLSKAENGALIAHARGSSRVYEAFFRQDRERDVLYKFDPARTK